MHSRKPNQEFYRRLAVEIAQSVVFFGTSVVLVWLALAL